MCVLGGYNKTEKLMYFIDKAILPNHTDFECLLISNNSPRGEIAFQLMFTGCTLNDVCGVRLNVKLKAY